jgi:hypothetical protein
MHTRSIRQRFVAGVIALIVLSLLVMPAMARHSWGKYHVPRPIEVTTGEPIPLDVGDNVSNTWDPYLVEAIKDWNQAVTLTSPDRIALNPVQGAAGGGAANCEPTEGRIEVCNHTYGSNGWLGIAQIWVTKFHITKGTALMNDTYFNQTRYNTLAWRQMVMCQEIAHDFGLDHQDERFSNPNLGSCMDYTNNPAGGIYNGVDYGPSNENPNAHDFEQLTMIYSHAETTRTPGGKGNAIGKNPSQWGEVIAYDELGRPSHYRKDLGEESAVFTFVVWAEDPPAPTVDDGTGDGAGDGGRNDGERDGGGKQDGGKKKKDGKQDGGKQRQGHHDRHRHR